MIRPDGTEEMLITRTSNGVTETVKRISHPDGTVEETRETGNGNNNGMMGRPWKLLNNKENEIVSQPPRMPEDNSLNTNNNNTGLLSGLWKRVFG